MENQPTIRAAGRPRGPSPRKRTSILDAARALFLEHGFAGTAIEDIADRASVSKQTIYTHFGNKDALFTELVIADVGRRHEPQHPLVAAMPHTRDLAGDLRTFARWHLALVMTPDLLRLRRMLIGESERFPALARAWYDNGPRQSSAIFARWFTALDRRGLLDVPDPDLAGEVFNWLVLSIPLNKAMAIASDTPLHTPEELDAYADEAVRVFLAAYGTH